MRNISFALTTEQIRNRTKTVTRRLGWKDLKPGTLLQPVVKVQGFRRGEHVDRIGGPIRVVSVTREALSLLSIQPRRARSEMRLEGFPDWDAGDFVVMFARHNRLKSIDAFVTRIQFEYVTVCAADSHIFRGRAAKAPRG